MYDTAKACGSCMQIYGSIDSVTVSVQDLCPSCPVNNMDLSKLAFSKISNLGLNDHINRVGKTFYEKKGF